MTKDPPVHSRVNLTADASDSPTNRPSSPCSSRRAAPRSSQRRAPQERGRCSANPRLTQQKAEASQFRALIELAPDALLAVDDLGQIALVNRQTELMFGYAREELWAKPIETLIPQRFRASHRRHRERYSRSRAHAPMSLDCPCLAADVTAVNFRLRNVGGSRLSARARRRLTKNCARSKRSPTARCVR
jgi:PAS domain-containing protein